MSIRTLKVRIELDLINQEKAWELSDHCKNVWNWANERRLKLFKHKKFISNYTQQKALTKWKRYQKKIGNKHYYNCGGRTYQFLLQKLDIAWSNTWKLRKTSPEKNHKLPRFKSRKSFHTLRFDAILYKNQKNKEIVGVNKQSYPIKFKRAVKLSKHVIKGMVGYLELSYCKNSKEWYLSIPYSVKNTVRDSEDQKVIAFDLGINTFAQGIDTEGNSVEIINTIKPVAKYFDKQADKLRSKRDICKKKSRRYRKLTIKLAKINIKKNKQIYNIQQSLTNKLVKEDYDTFVVGDLDQQEMTRSIQKSGLSKRAKKNINKAIHQNWYIAKFINYLSYKAETLGKKVVKINERGTTRTCNNCGYIFENGLDCSTRQFKCSKCNCLLPRDTNAAVNILNKYLKNICHLDWPFKFVRNNEFNCVTLKRTFNYNSKLGYS